MRRDVAPGSVGLCGPQALHWLRTPAPSEVVEVTAPPALRREIAASLGVAAHADLDDLHGGADPVVLAAALRFRAACRGRWPIGDVERDALVRALYAHVLRRHFGGRAPRRGGDAALDGTRLARVTAFVDAHAGEPLDLARLAAVAALSPFHFARAFKAATGLPPHRFVTALRIGRAEALLRRGDTGGVEAVARTLGHANLGHFRRAFRRQTGALPSALRDHLADGPDGDGTSTEDRKNRPVA